MSHAAQASKSPESAPARTEPADQLVETEHAVTIGGREIRYTVTTGTLVLREEAEKSGDAAGESEGEKPRASVFFIAYTRTDVADVARRHDLHPNLLHLRRRQACMGLLSDPAPSHVRFAPVAVAVTAPESRVATIEPDDARGGIIEVLLRNGRVLRLPDGIAPARVARLAEALEGSGR